MPLSALPYELLTTIFLSLSAPDFLSLTSTSHTFHAYRNEHSFWRHRAALDFRLPPQPLFETDGPRWHRLYRSLQTQSEVYTWGGGGHGNLGRHQDSESQLQMGYPRPMHGVSGPNGIGKIVDVQCGGWSTVLMNSLGKLFAAGVVDGERVQWQSRRGLDAQLVPVRMPMKPVMKWMLDVSSRAMSSFSMGRKRLLALSDHGEVIEWGMNFTVAGSVLSADHLHPHVDYDREPWATQVVAGWAHGSALYPGHGLYYWHAITPGTEAARGSVNLIMNGGGAGAGNDSVCIPGTRSGTKSAEGTLEARIGIVKQYIVLEHHIIMLTDSNKLFSWRTANDAWKDEHLSNHEPTELTSFYPPSDNHKVIDIQGSFRTFAVFISSSAILLGTLTEDSLPNTPRFPVTDASGDSIPIPLPAPDLRPVLQNAGIVQLAFGDYHFHALHLDGSVTSYGKESDYQGQLGLGRGPMAMLRGVDWSARGHGEGNVLLHPESEGRRRVWFEPEKFAYMATMLDKYGRAVQGDETFRQKVAERAVDVRRVYGEWFEQEGRSWEEGIGMGKEGGDAGDEKGRVVEQKQEQKSLVPAYYPIRIAAAGWSSAAVVLVDKERAERTRQSYLLPKSKPGPGPVPAPEKTEESEKSHPAQEAHTVDSTATVSWTEWLSSLARRMQTMTINPFSYEGPPCEEAEAYVWSQREFPRLRLPGGDDSLLRDGRGAEWKLGEPGWVRG